jgi:caspase domain-containing protein
VNSRSTQGAPRVTAAFVTASCLLFCAACGRDGTSAPGPTAAGAPAAQCSFAPEQRDASGKARLALLVGVGAYQHPSINKLSGPPQDVALMRALLTGPGGYGFPEANVCSLVDADATGRKFREAFQSALLKRAKRDDVIVIYFSGHGTQLPDTNHDESDLADEVLMLVDSRMPTGNDLRDDEFAALLKPLRETSGNVVVILDSCNSGSATRAASSTLVPRYQAPRAEDLAIVESPDAPLERGSSIYFTGAGPGLITISAAIDGTVALEKASAGVFTKALVSALSEANAQPLTYRQLQWKVPPLVAATSTQVSSFEGELDRVVFGAVERKQALALSVQSVGPPVKLGGTLIPGLGRNAELRVFDSDVSAADLNEPAKSKAMLIVDSATGLNAEARILNTRSGARPVAAGDIAVLVRPSDEAIAMQVRIRPASEPGGVPTERAARLRTALEQNAEAASLVKIGDQLADFEVSVDATGRYNVLGPEGQVRKVLEEEESVAGNLWMHARQRAFLSLRSEGGRSLIENQSLTVTVEPSSTQSSCARRGATLTKDEDGTVVVPLCYAWRLRASLAREAPAPLRLGGLILSSDGSVFGFPGHGAVVTVSPGGPSVPFDIEFSGGLPLGINDYILVFGTAMNNPVDWEALSATAATRSARAGPSSPLHRALDRFVSAAGSRGQTQNVPYEDSAWTRTVVTLRTEANPAFESGLTTLNPGSREYTIKSFDVRPYLPDDKSSALYRVLTKADWLAQQDFSYKQHAWDAGSDAANLSKGIDCSRSTWFAFTRVGLKYNSRDEYLATADMVRNNSRMSEQFEPCPLGENYQTGDLLVYRDDQQRDGHIVMVIDPAKRIAWGSHGWDGNAKKFNVPPDTGVEYQLIKYKADWQRWDRESMLLKACWRYKEFATARTRGMGSPGLAALGSNPCAAGACPVPRAPAP